MADRMMTSLVTSRNLERSRSCQIVFEHIIWNKA